MHWSQLKKTLKHEADTKRARHGKIPRDQFTTKNPNMPDTTKQKQKLLCATVNKRASEFTDHELSKVGAIYNELSQMAVATLTAAEGAHKRTNHKHRCFWLSQKHSHPLTTSSSDLCMVQSEPQQLPIVLTEKYFPQILSYLDQSTLENVGLVSQQLLIYSHHVHIIAFRAEQVMDSLTPLAKCWTVILSQEHKYREATSVLMQNVKNAQFIELRRVHKPSPVLVDIVMALGALISPNELPWKHVTADRSLLRRKNSNNTFFLQSSRQQRSLVGAKWSHCQQFVNHVEKDGHVVQLLTRMECFNPTTMTRRQLSVFRGILRTNVLKPSIAQRGGTLASHVAKWMVNVTRRALALDKMKLLGKTHRIDYQRGQNIIQEAKWHALVRSKLNDGDFRFIFGWS
tara:strand:+ start:32 stop:1231 length:1200 start_codon:yes stop_codon:yes gene_type:complete